MQVFNLAVTANTNILPDAFSHQYPGVIEIYAVFAGAGILSIKRTLGATTVTEKLNTNTNLTADTAYYFNIPYDTGETINLQYSLTTTCLKLNIKMERR